MNYKDWLNQTGLTKNDLLNQNIAEPFDLDVYNSQDHYQSLDIPENIAANNFHIGINLNLSNKKAIDTALKQGASCLFFKNGEFNKEQLSFVDFNLIHTFFNKNAWDSKILNSISDTDKKRIFIPKELNVEHPAVSLGIDSWSVVRKGANKTLELAYLLFQADKQNADHNSYFHFFNDSDFLLDIAKIRAFRFLIEEIIPDIKPYIHIEFNPKYYTINAVENNIFRQNCAIFSALNSNAQSFSAYDYKYRLGQYDPEALRNTINSQWVLKEESYQGEVIDPAKGSFYIENLTYQIAEKAWDYYIKLSKGELDLDLLLKEANEKRKITLLGSNLYPQDKLQKSENGFYDFEVL